MKENEKDKIMTLQRISNSLMLHGGFLNDPGLYAGEMGLVLFFTRYARYTQNELYMDYACDLTGKIRNSINQHTPINYKHGLAGIGSAIEYLVQNDYFEADTDAVLEDFDDRIFFTYNIPHLPVDEIMDISYYALWRMSGNSSRKDRLRRIVLMKIEKALHDHAVDLSLLQWSQQTITASLKAQIHSQYLEPIAKNDFSTNPPVLQNGLAGWGMSLLTELDGDDSWFSLLPNYAIQPINHFITNN